ELRLRRVGFGHAVTELARPLHASLVRCRAVRRCRTHPLALVLLAVVGPELPRELLRAAVVTDEQLLLRVDRVLAVVEGELEHARLGDRLRRARLDTQIAVDAPQVVDLVDEPVALARRDGIVGRVVGAADIDAARRTHARAELAADALLHPVL